MGLSFKPDIDDLRDSPSLTIVSRFSKLVRQKFFMVEPNILCLPSGMPSNMELIDLDDGKDADLTILLVNHKEFQSCDWLKLRKDNVLDYCGFYEKR